MGDKEENTYDIPIPLQYIGCQDLLGEEGCSHSGWLRKKRTVSIFTWPQAYVVLHEGCLYYFKNERERKPAGKFSLYGYNSVFRAGEIPPKEAPWVFKIVHSHSEFRTYFFSASSENEMKTWMVKIKQEMLKANGKVLQYSKKVLKDKPDDEHSFYQAVETSIYDDAAKFQVTKEYSKQYSIKRENEDSDDDEPKHPTHVDIDHRPPQPLPGQSTDFPDGDERAPLPPPRPIDGPAALPPKPPFKPPRIPDTDQPPTSSRHQALKAQESRSRSPSPNVGHDHRLMENLHSKFKEMNEIKKREDKKHTNPKRSSGANLVRGSYEPTDGPGNKSPSLQPKTYTPKFQIGTPRTSGGGSTGEDDFDTDVDTDDYWEAIHFRDGSKQQANDIIQAIGEEGVYLVRPGEDGHNKVLVVFAQDTIKKYRIQKSEDGQYFLAKEGFRNNQLEELLRFYYEEDLPTVQVKLTGPYRLHAKFKKLNL